MSKKLFGELAAAEAEQLIRDWGMVSLPIDPFQIAKDHDIMVVAKPENTAGVSGFLTKLGDHFVIAHASHIKNEGFVRFTIAHELGHYFLPGHPEKLFGDADGIHLSRSGFVTDDPIEIEADHFAAALLMPEDLFRDAIRDAGTGYKAVEWLAKLCNTSITATAIRYAHFADDPVAVFVSSGRNIDYCFMSSPLRDMRGIQWNKKGDTLPPTSETHDFNQDSDNIRYGNEFEGWTTLDLWFEGVPKLEMKEDVVGLGTYGKALTILFTEEPIDDIDDDDDDCEDD